MLNWFWFDFLLICMLLSQFEWCSLILPDSDALGLILADLQKKWFSVELVHLNLFWLTLTDLHGIGFNWTDLDFDCDEWCWLRLLGFDQTVRSSYMLVYFDCVALTLMDLDCFGSTLFDLRRSWSRSIDLRCVWSVLVFIVCEWLSLV